MKTSTQRNENHVHEQKNKEKKGKWNTNNHYNKWVSNLRTRKKQAINMRVRIHRNEMRERVLYARKKKIRKYKHSHTHTRSLVRSVRNAVSSKWNHIQTVNGKNSIHFFPFFSAFGLATTSIQIVFNKHVLLYYAKHERKIHFVLFLLSWILYVGTQMCAEIYIWFNR